MATKYDFARAFTEAKLYEKIAEKKKREQELHRVEMDINRSKEVLRKLDNRIKFVNGGLVEKYLGKDPEVNEWILKLVADVIKHNGG